MPMILDSWAKNSDRDSYEHRINCTLTLDPKTHTSVGERSWDAVLTITPNGGEVVTLTKKFTADLDDIVKGQALRWIKEELSKEEVLGGKPEGVVIMVVYWSYGH